MYRSHSLTFSHMYKIAIDDFQLGRIRHGNSTCCNNSCCSDNDCQSWPGSFSACCCTSQCFRSSNTAIPHRISLSRPNLWSRQCSKLCLSLFQLPEFLFCSKRTNTSRPVALQPGFTPNEYIRLVEVGFFFSLLERILSLTPAIFSIGPCKCSK